MRLIRRLLGWVVLAIERVLGILAPKAIVRAPADQALVDRETAKLAIYQFETCPFCVKVRLTVRRLGIRIELRDADKVARFKEELLRGGGEAQVPCLRIAGDDGSVRWLYESSDIVRYLSERFGARPGGERL